MKQSWVTGLFCVLATAAVAADSNSVRYDTDYNADRTYVADRQDGRNWVGYEGNELNFELFGTGTVGKDTLRNLSRRRVERDGKLGLGGGLSYFFTRYFGVNAYAYSESTGDHFIDNVGGDLVGRLPLGNSGVAPYVFAGGSRQLDPVTQWNLDAGAGVEWRFAPHVGVFVDGRYVWADKTEDYGLGRLGVRFGF